MTTDKVRSNMQMLKRARTFIIPQLAQTENCSNDIHIICKENELMKTSIMHGLSYCKQIYCIS